MKAKKKHNCLKCIHICSIQQDVICHIWCSKTDRDFTFGNENTEICKLFELDN